jgi:hypothetical protein
MDNITFIFGSRIFSSNKRQLNEYARPEDCKDNPNELCDGCKKIWNPKTKECECRQYPEVDQGIVPGCTEENLIIAREQFNDIYYNLKFNKETCCFTCDEAVINGCIQRGWSPKIDFSQINSDTSILDCGCNCDETKRIYYSSWNPSADNIPYIKENECPEGLWNQFLCLCECDKGSVIVGKKGICYENQILGSNCDCYCNNFPENGCGVDNKNRVGIWDNDRCECVYPCGEGWDPYFCTGKNGENYIGCSDCKDENTHLSPCDEFGQKHCCPSGYFYLKGTMYYNPEYPMCVPCEAPYSPNCGDPLRLNTDTCTCCPEGYVFLNGEGCVCKDYALNTCEQPRELVFNTDTEQCDCECPENYIWTDNDCILFAEVCPRPGDNPLHTRWDATNEKCECELGNEFLNDCFNSAISAAKYLNEETCECECSEGSSLERELYFWELEHDMACKCDTDRQIPFIFLGTVDEEKFIDNHCYTCAEINGEHSQMVFVDIQGNEKICKCNDGYIFEKYIPGSFYTSRQCISCQEYDPNSIVGENGSCQCASGYIKSYDNDAGEDPDLWSCIQIETTTTTPTPETPTPETPTPETPETPTPETPETPETPILETPTVTVSTLPPY